jgi:hypothetical protein
VTLIIFSQNKKSLLGKILRLDIDDTKSKSNELFFLIFCSYWQYVSVHSLLICLLDIDGTHLQLF